MGVAARLALALDPVRLAGAAGISPDEWQARVLRSPARQILLLCSRQAGKSTVSALLAVDEALHRAPALVLVLAPTIRQSQELYRRIRSTLDTLGAVAGEVETESALALELSNGSRTVSLPSKESNIRGFSAVSLLLVDEAARVPDSLFDAIRPMLAVSGGRIVLLSTPWGKRGFFHHIATNGDALWERVTITALDCPRIPREWLEHERANTPRLVFESEYLCKFVETDDLT